jgi:SAM-dependent methyltransferase
MQIHKEELSDVSRYLELKGHLRIEDMRGDYEAYLRVIRRFTPLGPQSRILEIGTGTGWFPIMAKQEGLQVKGLEISQQLVDHARRWGRELGVEPDIELGNAEEHDIGDNEFDAVVANSVFEHIEKWQLALQRVAKALRPGGMFFFTSTNRFCPHSHEYPMLFYSWMPDQMRYRFRQKRQGPDIMKLGIDFNSFTYPQLRNAFQTAGFRQVLDRVDLVETARFPAWKRTVLEAAKSSSLLKWPILTFCDATVFVAVK